MPRKKTLMKRQMKLTRASDFHAQSAAYNQALNNQALMAQQQEQIRLLQLQAAANAGPGRWAPDPAGRFARRYYDGERWTQWVIDAAGQQHIDPVP